MKLTMLRFLADENIDAGVIDHLRSHGKNVVSVLERGWGGQSDSFILEKAKAESRVVMTHDRDFGYLAINDSSKVYGIIFLRPGHLSLEFTLGTLNTLFRDAPELRIPFIVVSVRANDDVSIRVRFLDLDPPAPRES